MTPTKTPETNKNLKHKNCVDLPAQFDGEHLITCWELNDSEIEQILKTRRIYHAVWTKKPCLQPLWLGVVAPKFTPAGTALETQNPKPSKDQDRLTQ